MLRPLRASDVDALVTIEQACFPAEDRFSRRQLAHLLRRALPAGTAWGLLARAVNAPALGAAVFLTRRDSRVARLYTIAVAPAARGQGVGEALLRAALRRLQARGFQALSLEVRADNAVARRLYERFGFRPCARLPAYYRDGMAGIRYVLRIAD